MSRSKHSYELKMKAVKAYLSGEVSYHDRLEQYCVGQKCVQTWVSKYRAHGEIGLMPRARNTTKRCVLRLYCEEKVALTIL